MRNVVDLRPAIEAGAAALQDTARQAGHVMPEDIARRVAELVITTAAPVLGITDLGSIPDTRIRPPLPKSTGVIYTETIEPKEDLL